MTSNPSTSSESQESPSEDYGIIKIGEEVRNTLSLNAWHSVLRASCKFINGILSDVTSGRKLLEIKNPYEHLFLKSSQDLRNVEPLQPTIYTEAARQSQDQWKPLFKFLHKPLEPAQVFTPEMKLNMLEQQLTLIIHASRCLKRQHHAAKADEYTKSWPKCYNNTPYCHIMRCIFEHLINCKTRTGNCSFGFCEPAKRIISHFKNCPGKRCPLCSRVSYLLPAKPLDRRNAVDERDLNNYMTRVAIPSTVRPGGQFLDFPVNQFNPPSPSGFENVPAPDQVLENVNDDLQLDEPEIIFDDEL